jgi:hypothetical protein
MANLSGIVLSGSTFTHVEVEATRAAVVAYAQQLQQELAAHPQSPVFRLQIQRSGVAPTPGGGTPITAGHSVTASLHPHP